jgi:SP family myo-inositol transporter-like MFS transporter 13
MRQIQIVNGTFCSAMLYVPSNGGMGGMSSIWKELIVSITPGMAGVSSLIAGPASDYFGRKRIIVVASLVFSAGALLCAAAPERYTLLLGRILLGIAIGK